MRNVLAEFVKERHGQRKPSILGLREHIFTGRLVKYIFLILFMIGMFLSNSYSLHLTIVLYISVSSLAWFMSNQETSFVTIGQRVLADPLR